MDKLRNITAAEVHREDTDFLLNYYKKKVCSSWPPRVKYSTVQYKLNFARTAVHTKCSYSSSGLRFHNWYALRGVWLVAEAGPEGEASHSFGHVVAVGLTRAEEVARAAGARASPICSAQTHGARAIQTAA